MVTLVALFDEYSDADRAVDTLKQYGIDESRISLI